MRAAIRRWCRRAWRVEPRFRAWAGTSVLALVFCAGPSRAETALTGSLLGFAARPGFEGLDVRDLSNRPVSRARVRRDVSAGVWGAARQAAALSRSRWSFVLALLDTRLGLFLRERRAPPPRASLAVNAPPRPPKRQLVLRPLGLVPLFGAVSVSTAEPAVGGPAAAQRSLVLRC